MVNFTDDLSGDKSIKIKTRNSNGSKNYHGDAYIYEKIKIQLM